MTLRRKLGAARSRSRRSSGAVTGCVRTREPPAALGVRLPPWMGSIRFRIALLTSGSALVVIAGLVVGAFHLGISATLEDEQGLNELARLPGGGRGRPLRADTLVVADAVDLERADERGRCGRSATSARRAGRLFVFSLGVAWVVAGRLLRPVDTMRRRRRDRGDDPVARIALEGPDHELKRLADAFDGMLARLESAFAAAPLRRRGLTRAPQPARGHPHEPRRRARRAARTGGQPAQPRGRRAARDGPDGGRPA